MAARTLGTRSKDKLEFVADGRERACAAIEPTIRSAVLTEYADRFRQATWWGRFWLRVEMNREIKRRIEMRAPETALY